MTENIDKEIELLQKKVEDNRTTILSITEENRAIENTIALLKLKRSGILTTGWTIMVCEDCNLPIKKDCQAYGLPLPDSLYCWVTGIPLEMGELKKSNNQNIKQTENP